MPPSFPESGPETGTNRLLRKRIMRSVFDRLTFVGPT